MNVVFLDFDGVITTADSYARGLRSSPETLLDTALVATVDTLCRKANAVVVISSTWRRLHSLDELKAWLKAKGLSAEVIGATPAPRLRMSEHGHRGREISAWLAEHPGVASFVILEDEEDVSPYRHRQVRTCFWDAPPFGAGFTEGHLAPALALMDVE